MTRPIVIAANYREFSDWCHSQQLHENDALYIRYPDQLRGQQTDRVVWLTTPERWSKADVDEARMGAKLAARLGDAVVEGLPPDAYSAADLVNLIHQLLTTTETSVTCGKVAANRGAMLVRAQDGAMFRIAVEEV